MAVCSPQRPQVKGSIVLSGFSMTSKLDFSIDRGEEKNALKSIHEFIQRLGGVTWTNQEREQQKLREMKLACVTEPMKRDANGYGSSGKRNGRADPSESAVDPNAIVFDSMASSLEGQGRDSSKSSFKLPLPRSIPAEYASRSCGDLPDIIDGMNLKDWSSYSSRAKRNHLQLDPLPLEQESDDNGDEDGTSVRNRVISCPADLSANSGMKMQHCDRETPYKIAPPPKFRTGYIRRSSAPASASSSAEASSAPGPNSPPAPGEPSVTEEELLVSQGQEEGQGEKADANVVHISSFGDASVVQSSGSLVAQAPSSETDRKKRRDALNFLKAERFRTG